MADFGDYEGREQAWVKHWLLENYLERLIMKVGTQWPSFVYLDAYAGPWKATTEDLSDTSFGVAVKTMRSCQQKLAEGGRQVKMRAVFCEKHRARAKRLIDYAAEHSEPGLELVAMRTDFTAKIDEISASLTDTDFTFALVDPTGFKEIAPNVLAPLLRNRSVELLINLMWDHPNRFWNLDSIGKTLDAVFGSDRKEKIAVDEASQLYARGLRETAGGAGGRLYASAFPVQNPEKDRTHYYLVYATHSPQGLLTFDKTAEQTWQEQAIAKARKQVSKDCTTGDLWGGEVLDARVTRFVDVPRIRTAWLRRLPVAGAEITVDYKVMAELLEECGCLEIDLQQVLFELYQEGVISNAAIKGKRSRNAVNYDKREKLRREK